MGAPQATGLTPNGSGCGVQKQRGPAALARLFCWRVALSPGTDVVGANRVSEVDCRGSGQAPGIGQRLLGAAVRQALSASNATTIPERRS
jgi:hypothetical protein